VWVMGAGLVLALAMIVGMLGLIVVEGSATFWPRPIDRVTLNAGQVFMGIPIQTDAEHGRRLYRVGNRDAGQQPFRWVDLKDIKSTERPRSALMLERTEWGIWIGEAQAVVVQDDIVLSSAEAAQPPPSEAQTEYGTGPVERTKISEDGGRVTVRQRTFITAQAGGALESLT